MNADTIKALQLILKEGEKVTWIHSQGSRLFKIDLSGIVDDEKPLSNYLRIRSQHGHKKSN